MDDKQLLVEVADELMTMSRAAVGYGMIPPGGKTEAHLALAMKIYLHLGKSPAARYTTFRK